MKTRYGFFPASKQLLIGLLKKIAAAAELRSEPIVSHLEFFNDLVRDVDPEVRDLLEVTVFTDLGSAAGVQVFS